MTDPGVHTIAAIVLAYSRFEYMIQLIDALRNQTRRPDEIVVVNQGSRADTAEWLQGQPDLVVIRQENRGSAGGFSRGIEASIARGHAWTWIFDDDAVPKLDALERLVEKPYFERDGVAFLACRIVDPTGKTYMSPAPANAANWYGSVLEDHCVEVMDGTWLGLLVSTRAVRAVGLPISEFFLWDEDREFISRLLQYGRGYCAIESVIVHHQNPTFDAFGADFIKLAYYARNNVARQKLGSAPIPVKALRVVRRSLSFVGCVLRREAPLKLLPWVIRGALFFWPRVRYLE